jgi:hypothetical protein
MGNSRVVIDNCRLDSNINFGVHVMGNARVTISNSQINSTGFRAGQSVNNTPSPGTGIMFDDQSSGTVAFTTVNGSAKAGIANNTQPRNRQAVKLLSVNVFDNLVDFDRITPPTGSIPTIN